MILVGVSGSVVCIFYVSEIFNSVIGIDDWKNVAAIFLEKKTFGEKNLKPTSVFRMVCQQ